MVGGGLNGGFTDSLYQNTRSVEWYMGDGVMGYLRADRVGYMRVAKKGTYEIMVAIPNDVVFYYRTISMFVVSGAFLLVLITMYAQASILLREVVVKGFQRTNDALARITDGDLDEAVDVQPPDEFAYLSDGCVPYPRKTKLTLPLRSCLLTYAITHIRRWVERATCASPIRIALIPAPLLLRLRTGACHLIPRQRPTPRLRPII